MKKIKIIFFLLFVSGFSMAQFSVPAQPYIKRLIFSGNSLFNFANANLPYGYAAPLACYNALSATKKPAISYFAIGGRTLTQLLGEFTSTGIKRMIRPGDIVVFNELTNSLIATPNVTAVYGQLLQYRDSVRAQGGLFVMCTMMARNEFYVGTEADRVAINLMITTAPAGTFDAIVDLGSTFPWNSTANTGNTTYYNADNCHQTTTGYTLMGTTISPIIQPFFQ